MKSKILFILMVSALVFISCIKETIQLDQVSKDIELQRSVALPLVKASFTFGDLTDVGFDTDMIDGIPVMLYTIDVVTYEDTIKFGGLSLENIDLNFDYIYLHHSTRNMLPVGLRLNLFLYDSISQTNIDTVPFSRAADGQFLHAPSLYPNGLVIEDEVETIRDRLELDQQTLDNLFENTTHIIISAEVPETNTVVKILDHYSLKLNLGITAPMSLVTNLDSLLSFSNRDSLLTSSY